MTSKPFYDSPPFLLTGSPAFFQVVQLPGIVRTSLKSLLLEHARSEACPAQGTWPLFHSDGARTSNTCNSSEQLKRPAPGNTIADRYRTCGHRRQKRKNSRTRWLPPLDKMNTPQKRKAGHETNLAASRRSLSVGTENMAFG
jgi:hypothetical protein